MGTFVVRSGLLTSVHAFATDPDRGVFILVIMAAFLGGALTLFAVRANELEAKGVFSSVSRESALVMNNVLLAVSSFVVFIGTMWPLVSEMLFDRVLSVGPPFFDAAFTPFRGGAGDDPANRRDAAVEARKPVAGMRPLWGLAALSLAMGALVWAMQTGRIRDRAGRVALGLWVVLGAGADLWMRTGAGRCAGRIAAAGAAAARRLGQGNGAFRAWA